MPPHYCGRSQILQIRRHLADDQLESFTITPTDSSDDSDMDKDTDTGSLTGTLPAVIDKKYNADDIHQDIQVFVLFSWYSFLHFYMFCDSISVCSVVLSVRNNVSASILYTHDGLEVNLFMHHSSRPELPPLHQAYFFLTHFLFHHPLHVSATFPERSHCTMGENSPVFATTVGLLLTLLADVE